MTLCNDDSVLGGEICRTPEAEGQVEMNESRSKIHGLALDLVEEGKDLSLWEEKVQKKKHPLPEGVTDKMMYSDVIRIAWPSMVELLLTQLASMVDPDDGRAAGCLGAYLCRADNSAKVFVYDGIPGDECRRHGDGCAL